MQVDLFPFQKQAVAELRNKTAEALGSYKRTSTPQVVSLQAPTGSGKTLIMAALIEAIYFGTEQYEEQPEAIFVWLSDSPALNEQSKQKIERKADKIRISQCKIISDESFDQEMLDDGCIYFLNTQKLGRGGNLGRHSDSRQYTIWETLENTRKAKSDRLYFIIDEAHRGMQGREAGTATTIMQRFIKGWSDCISPMPLVIGISATAQRFNTLVGDTSSTLQKCIISADRVRSSGLLKDRIVIKYSEDRERYSDMTVLQAACDEWKNKCIHWYQYCTEERRAQVNPVFVIQVQAGNEDRISNTPLDEVLAALEERLGTQLKENEVVHTFGSIGTITLNNLPVPHVEPENITEDRRIKVVFFKENLSTGWDCPRAETMMSFRKAEDYTYIAQLLGRMVRTPLQCHINVDDFLNDVNLYLPYFNRQTVNQVIEELKNTEGGDIPTEINGESLEEPLYEMRTIHPPVRHHVSVDSGHPDLPLYPLPENDSSIEPIPQAEITAVRPQQEPTPTYPVQPPQPQSPSLPPESSGVDVPLPQPVGSINREEIVRFINEKGFPTYDVRNVRINSYLESMTSLAALLVQNNIYPNGSKEIRKDVSEMIHGYIDNLHSVGRYQTLVNEVLSFKLSVQVFDVFGEALGSSQTSDFFAASESDLDRQLRQADTKMGSAGFPNEYGRNYGSEEDPNQYKIDCILFASDESCINRLNSYAERKFHELDDRFRRQIIDKSESLKKQYNDIVSNGDAISRHSFSLPENIKERIDADGKEYDNHLFVNDNGLAKIKLNSWEDRVLEEEMKQTDFVCWLRNPSRGTWALAIPRDDNGTMKPMYPDFLIVRRDLSVSGGYVVDIIEPHGQQYADNLSKAKAFAKYAREEGRMGRIQMCREVTEAGIKRFKRLDFTQGAIQEKVLGFQRNEELDHLFETDGFSME